MRSLLSVAALATWVASALDEYGGGSGVVTTDPVEVSFQDHVVVFKMPIDYTYHRANLWCENFGSHLASSHNSYTHEQIEDGLASVGLSAGDAWIGLYSDGSSWHWQDGSGINYDRWATGSGGGGAGTNQRGVFDGASSEWVQVAQDYRTPGIVCAGHSFALHVGKEDTPTANTNCQGFYTKGHLLTIHTPELNTRLRFLGNTYFVSSNDNSMIIGFKDDVDEGKFYWIDGSPTTYKDWYGSEPNNAAGGTEHCAHMRNTKDFHWNDIPCTSQFHYLCATPSNHANSVVFTAAHDGQNYSYHVTDWYGTFEQAEEYCKNTYNEHVASIPNAEINENIRKAAKGLGVDEIWIGYFASSGQVWEWTDESTHEYDNWGEGQPVEHEHAQLRSDTGYWENVAGSNLLGGVACNRGGPPAVVPPLKAVKADAKQVSANGLLADNWMAVAAASISVLALFGLYYFYSSPKSNKFADNAKSSYTYGAV